MSKPFLPPIAAAQVIALGDKEASISPSRDPSGAINGRRFPPPWFVEDYPIGARRRIERSQTAGKGDRDG